MQDVAHCIKEVFKTLDLDMPPLNYSDNGLSFRVKQYLVAIQLGDKRQIKLTEDEKHSTTSFQNTTDVYNYVSSFIDQILFPSTHALIKTAVRSAA